MQVSIHGKERQTPTTMNSLGANYFIFINERTERKHKSTHVLRPAFRLLIDRVLFRKQLTRCDLH